MSPHANRELELMLAGRKPLARFVREFTPTEHVVGDEEFDAAVEDGRIVRIIVRDHDHERRYYCLPTEEWRVKALEMLFHSSGLRLDEYDMHRLDGTLLGYPKSTIEQFVKRVRRLKTLRD